MTGVHLIGVDLAWGPRRRTGLAVLDESGTLLDLADLHGDEEILDWLRPWTDGPCLVAIDAPLVVANAEGSRPCEKALNADFRRYDAGAHPSNLRRPELAAGLRGARLARALGLDLDPRSTVAGRAIEVYPHPATVVLFGLGRTIKYKHKPGRDLDFLRAESQRLLSLLESLADARPPLRLDHPAWDLVRRRVATAATKSELRAVEDTIDAVVCAYVALFAWLRPEDTTTYGDLATGYIVTPRPAWAST